MQSTVVVQVYLAQFSGAFRLAVAVDAIADHHAMTLQMITVIQF